ncbi:MAG: hypothetical protein IJW94_05970 [Oscillospiraceae bacterium]|nr:hypothetical protein [Oscillospiraceae bacterium]
MEEEYFLSGYCRQNDSSRTVTVETDGSAVTHIGCGYNVCPYKEQCPIGQRIAEIKGAV